MFAAPCQRFILSVLVLICSFPVGADEPQSAAKTVKVAGLVIRWVRGDKAANFQRIEPMIREAAAKGAKIVVTTECFLDGYAIADRSIPLDDYRALGEPIPEGQYFRKLAALAKELNIYLVAGMTEADGDTRYNTVVVIGPDGRLIGIYRKQQLGHELGRNTPGKLSPVFPTPFGNMGVVICADRRDPELVKTICTNGADFILCPSGGMFGPKSNDPILQARSKENGIHIVFVHPIEFLVTAPDGAIVRQELTGDSLLVKPAEINGKQDGKHIFYFELPVAAQAGLDKESAAILKLVQESRRTGFEKHDLAAYLAPWADDAKLIIGRTATPDKYDVTLGFAQIKATRELRFRVPPEKGTRMTFENARVDIQGDRATVTYLASLGPTSTKETAEEIFLLRKTAAGWKIYENRGWLIRAEHGKNVTNYNAQLWKDRDAEVENARKTKDPAKLAQALVKAFRFAEARDAAREWTKQSPANVEAWINLGLLALVNGDANECLAANQQALKLDTNARVPDYIKAGK